MDQALFALWDEDEPPKPEPLVDIETQEKLQAAGWLTPPEAMQLRRQLAALREQANLDSWRLNPDRMGQ